MRIHWFYEFPRKERRSLIDTSNFLNDNRGILFYRGVFGLTGIFGLVGEDLFDFSPIIRNHRSIQFPETQFNPTHKYSSDTAPTRIEIHPHFSLLSFRSPPNHSVFSNQPHLLNYSISLKLLVGHLTVSKWAPFRIFNPNRTS